MINTCRLGHIWMNPSGKLGHWGRQFPGATVKKLGNLCPCEEPFLKKKRVNKNYQIQTLYRLVI